MNKAIEDIEELCKTYIKSKYIRIIKSKKTTSTIRQLQEIYIDLWGPNKPSSISASGKNYLAILFDKFTRKLWIFMLRSKDKFFDIFKFWLPKAKACENKLDCL